MCANSEVPTIEALKAKLAELAVQVSMDVSEKSSLADEVKRVAAIARLFSVYERTLGPEETGVGMFRFGPIDLAFAKRLKRSASVFAFDASIWPGYRDTYNFVNCTGGGNKLSLRALIWTGLQEIKKCPIEPQE